MLETLRAVVERARTVDVRAEAQAKRVAETLWASQGASFYSPLPLVADRTPSVRGTWVDAEESGAQRVDVDAEGRPLVVWSYGEPLWVWTYGERRWEQLRMYGEVAWYELEDGRPAWMAGVNDHAWMLERWTWAEGSVVRVDHAEAIARGWPHAWAATATYDSSGLVRITQAVEKGDYREDNRLPPDEAEDALEAALARAAALTPDRVAWARSLHAPEEMPDEPADLAERTVAAFANGVVAAVAASGVAEPFFAVVQEPPNAFEPYPPDVLVVADSWRQGMLAAGRHDREVLERPWEAVDAGHAVRLPLAEHVDEDGLRGCRVLRTALLGSRGEREAGGRLATQVGRELSRRLNTRDDAPVTLVELGDERGNRIYYALALAEAANPVRMERFYATLREQEAAPAADPRAALYDRGALAELLSAHKLDPQVAYDVAEFGLRLLPDPDARSRLGGPALLPAGEPWPHNDAGQPLTFLAGIDLSERPAYDGRDVWPDGGWLLFFADLGEEPEFLEVCGNADRARVLYASDVVPVDPPGEALGQRSVRMEPMLTLPEELDLDAFAKRSYEEVVAELYNADPNTEWTGDDWPPQHWLGGRVGYLDPGTSLLLQFSDDEKLEFYWLDAGLIRFTIPPEDLAAPELSRVSVFTESS